MRRVVQVAALMAALSTGACIQQGTFEDARQSPYRATIATVAPAEAVVACLAPKLDGFPLLISLPGEGRTLIADMRRTGDTIDLYQRNAGHFLMTLVSVRPGAIDVYVMPHLTRAETIFAAYRGFAKDCAAGAVR